MSASRPFKRVRILAKFALVVTATSLCAGAPKGAYAFKVETHIWIAQRIINDLARSDTLAIIVSGQARSAKVPANVRDAILANQQEFLLGSIGPDAFPGIYEGQMTIHPGLDVRGWGTGDWLSQLVRKAQTPAERAFAYGALVHAASDVFAHTYVNSYAGHIYSLTDGELDVEKRHFLLEGYIASKMPRLQMPDGKSAGPIDQLLFRNGRLPVPTQLLRRALYDDGTAARQWAKNGSPHIRGFHDLHRELSNLSSKGGPLDKLHTTAQKLVVYYYTGVEISDADLKKLNDAHQRIRDVSNKSIDKLQQADRGFRVEVEKVLTAAHGAELAALKGAKELLDGLRRLNSEWSRLEQDVVRLDAELRRFGAPIIDTVRGGVRDTPHCRLFPRLPDCQILRQVPRADPARDLAVAALNRAQEHRNRALGGLDKSLSDYKKLTEIAHRTAKDIREAKAKVAHDSLDLAQAFTKDVDPVKSIVLEWIRGYDAAMDAYYLANAEAIRLAMIHKPPLPPLKAWVDCRLPAVVGVPVNAVDAKCTATSAIASIRTAMNSLKKLAVKDVPILREIEQVQARIEEVFKVAAREEMTGFGSKLLGVDLATLLDILSKDATADLLNQEFARTEGSKKLVLFDNVSVRINKEMGLRTSGPEVGTFDPATYPVVFNAEVLSRLALLDAPGLAAITGIKSFGSGTRAENIMFGMASSIDGNHQWLNNAPPYPRRKGASSACGKQFGFPEQFALWKPGSARKAFVGMFKGPLVPGIEVPESLGLSPALPRTYPYRPTLKNPYPNWTASDNKGNCVANW